MSVWRGSAGGVGDGGAPGSGAGSRRDGPLSWSRIERILSGKSVGKLTPGYGVNGHRRGGDGDDAGSVGGSGRLGGAANVRANGVAGGGDGGVDLHCRSSYSFLHGASDPADLVDEAVRLGLRALGIADRDGLYGVARFAEAAAEAGLDTIIGAELSLPQAPLTVLARGPEGYRRLSRVINDALMSGGKKGVVRYPALPGLAQAAGGHWQVLADVAWLPHLGELVAAFGPDDVAVGLLLPRHYPDWI